MLTTVVLVLCVLCSPGNIVPTEERSRGATVYRAGFCQFSKSCHREKCHPPIIVHTFFSFLLPPGSFARRFSLVSSQEIFSLVSSQEGFLLLLPSPLDKLFPSIYYMCIIYFPFPRRKAPHHNPASIFIDSLISASGGFCSAKPPT